MGRARERVLDEHTYAHRARQVLELAGTSTLAAEEPCPSRGASRSSRPATRRARSRGVLEELHAFDPGLDVVVVDDGSSDRTAADRGRPARRSSGCRSTSASAAPSRPASSTPRARLRRGGAAGRRRPARPAELPKLLGPLAAGEADIVVGSRFAARWAATTAAARAPRSASASSRGSSRCSCGQRVTDTTSGFQALNRRGIALFAADYPHDYPEVEATVMVHQHRLRLREVPVRCASASTGARRSTRCAPSTTWSRSARALRRLFRRSVVRSRRKSDDAVRISIVATIASVLLLLVVFELIRSGGCASATRCSGC